MKNIENTTGTTEYKELNSLDFFKEKSENLENENQLLKHTVEEQDAKIKWYEEQFRLSQDKKFGSSSEKISSEQLSIFNEAEKESQKESVEPDIEEITYKRKKSKTKRRKTYEDLEVEEIYYELSKEEQICPKCGNELHEMKIEIRKELIVIPAQVKIRHHKKQVYACRTCDPQKELVVQL